MDGPRHARDEGQAGGVTLEAEWPQNSPAVYGAAPRPVVASAAQRA
ncbi:hypothetical protein ACFY41_21410 [Streptomyces syringium]